MKLTRFSSFKFSLFIYIRSNLHGHEPILFKKKSSISWWKIYLNLYHINKIVLSNRRISVPTNCILLGIFYRLNFSYMIMSRCQLCQHFTHEFFVQKCFEQLFSSYAKHFHIKNALVKCWWNWHQDAMQLNAQLRRGHLKCSVHKLNFIFVKVCFFWNKKKNNPHF